MLCLRVFWVTQACTIPTIIHHVLLLWWWWWESQMSGFAWIWAETSGIRLNFCWKIEVAGNKGVWRRGVVLWPCLVLGQAAMVHPDHVDLRGPSEVEL
jgi:hypothetical protein